LGTSAVNIMNKEVPKSLILIPPQIKTALTRFELAIYSLEGSSVKTDICLIVALSRLGYRATKETDE